MSHGVRMERLTKIIDADAVPPMTSPNGVADCDLPESEARLWLLSEASRKAGGRVAYDHDSERWVVAGTGLAEKRCEVCRKIFVPLRNTARYDTARCRKEAQRTKNVTLTGRLVPQ